MLVPRAEAVTLEAALAEALRPVIREELERALAGKGPSMLTTEQAASIANVQPKTVRTWVLEGQLKATKRGRSLRIARADLDAFLAGDTRPAAVLMSTLTKR